MTEKHPLGVKDGIRRPSLTSVDKAHAGSKEPFCIMQKRICDGDHKGSEIPAAGAIQKLCDKMNEREKAVIFDMDGVLLDSMKYHALSFKRALNEIGIDINEKSVYKLEGKGAEDTIVHLLRKEGMEPEKKIVEKLVGRKREIFDSINKTEPFPGVKKLLDSLGVRFKLALVTGSTRGNVEGFLEKYFDNVFDVVVAGEDTEDKKPDPGPYLHCLEKLGSEAQECLVVENAPLGVKSAKNAGIECWAVATYLDGDLLREAGADEVFRNHNKMMERFEELL